MTLNLMRFCLHKLKLKMFWRNEKKLKSKFLLSWIQLHTDMLAFIFLRFLMILLRKKKKWQFRMHLLRKVYIKYCLMSILSEKSVWHEEYKNHLRKKYELHFLIQLNDEINTLKMLFKNIKTYHLKRDSKWWFNLSELCLIKIMYLMHQKMLIKSWNTFIQFWIFMNKL